MSRLFLSRNIEGVNGRAGAPEALAAYPEAARRPEQGGSVRQAVLAARLEAAAAAATGGGLLTLAS
jgi:hypothetical protein